MSAPRATTSPATPDGVPRVAACLASAFFEDPLWGVWSFPDEDEREQRLTRLMGFWAAAAVRHEWVRVTPGVESAAVWIPPGEPEMTAEEEVSFGALLDDLYGPRIAEVNALFDLFDQHHPREPHFYLALWGTHAAHRGRGVGAGLMADCLARVDERHMPAYLESTNPVNRRRYESLGFRAVGEFAPADGPTITSMWREAS